LRDIVRSGNLSFDLLFRFQKSGVNAALGKLIHH
jgi:hypothetical protein